MKTLLGSALFLFAAILSLAQSPFVAERPTAFGCIHPRISPDGNQIAVSYQGAIWTYEIESGKLTRLSKKAGGWDIEPVWSPDGNRIAFVRSPYLAMGNVVVIDSKTGDEILLKKPVKSQKKLWYSKDGTQLFSQFVTKQGLSPAWYDLESGEISPLNDELSTLLRTQRKRPQFAVSRDGETIFYAVHRDENQFQTGTFGPEADVWKCSADGSGAEKLFAWPARIYDIEPTGNDDGLFITTDLGAVQNDIWQVLFSDPLKHAKRLTSNHADDERASVCPETDQLVWTDNSEGSTKLMLRDLKTNSTRELAVTEFDFREPTGLIALSKPENVVRVSIKRKDGKFYAPPGALYRFTALTGHFYVDEETVFRVPVGDYEVRTFRGPEYVASFAEVSIAEGSSIESATKVSIDPKRWTHMAERGWYSGENHVHANYGYGSWYNRPTDIFKQVAGENLNVCNAVIGNSDGEAVFDREYFLGQVDPRSTDDTLIYWGQEFRSTMWGHMTLSNMTKLIEPIMTGFGSTTNPDDVPTNADIAQRAIDQGTVIGYTHPASNKLDPYDQAYAAKGLPVDAALGRVNLMDVQGHTYEGSVPLWYRYLNCGLPMIGTSGTDCFLNRIRSYPPGWARTYVHLPEGLTYKGWTEGQVAGRSFITNGPVLSFSVNDLAMGETLTLEKSGKVQVQAKAEFSHPLDRAELIFNGDVIEDATISEDKKTAEFSGEIEIKETGWLAFRAHAPPVRDIVREPNAHTNPIWVEVKGVPNSKAQKDAAYFLGWIDRLENDLGKRDRIPNEREWTRVRAQLEKAREFYKKLL